MSELIISLAGKVYASNFDDWKQGLIALIKSTQIELATDNDFYKATKRVNAFKQAENTLKQAKQEAISQVADIQKLFAAIDEIMQEARQTRLILERQIKHRKVEIKNECIQFGIDSVQSLIDNQTEEFRVFDTSRFVSRTRFEEVIKGKSSKSGAQAAIDTLIQQITGEISEKNQQLNHIKARVNALDDDYKLLFQDWKNLAELTDQQLEFEIEERISKFSTLLKRKEPEVVATDLINLIINDEFPVENEKYRIIIEVVAPLGKARELARSIRDRYGNNSFVCLIKLLSCPDSEN